MAITKGILEWADKKAIEAEKEGNMTKAVVSGFVEGAVDGAVIFYPMVLAAAYYWKHKALDKK